MNTIKVSIENNKNRKCLAANRCAARTIRHRHGTKPRSLE